MSRDRRDAKRRRPTDENYDPRTLYLPPDFVKRLTGGQVRAHVNLVHNIAMKLNTFHLFGFVAFFQRQWWEFKSNHMDKVVFFKVDQ